MIDDSLSLCWMKEQSLIGTSPQTAGILCCEASGCQERSYGGCCFRERSISACCDGPGWVDADCLGAHMRKASALVWSCRAQWLWKQVPDAPLKKKKKIVRNFKYILSHKVKHNRKKPRKAY